MTISKKPKKTPVKKKWMHEPNVAVRVGKSYSGLGLFALEDIQKGTHIVEYDGVHLDDNEADERGGKYLFMIDDEHYIDGSPRNNIARYFNHSCRANAGAFNIDDHIIIIAKKNILSGEEITYNYGKWYFKEIIGGKSTCLCPSCVKKRGKLQ